ncbi:AAA family ATPase [Actinacidiphila acididurans]|uniref:AAA family ATPase n=1 Tax=Actinacidiphila acididurans TaxID=2784346 RepID=A0ABS2TMG2_9ACTN|nr:AAA family ATPase [Actinacidiphila acididurans]MBM9504534.1 AAA family ATPase [Actinacidiphila acididurans]
MTLESPEVSARLALYWLLNPETAPLESLPEDVQGIVAAVSSRLPAPVHDANARALIDARNRESAELEKAREIASYNRAKARAADLEEEEQRGRIEELADALISETLTSDTLDSIPALVPVVDGLLYRQTVARINGRPGSMKSFAALDIAGCVAAGIPWADRTTFPGPVLYLVAEGAGGIRKRVRAWEQHRGRRMTDVHFLPRPVQIAGPEWLVLEEACRRIRPVLVVLDTQARATVGIEESSNERMGPIFARVERLAKGCDACATLVHHTGHQGEHGRGASAILGAVQTELLMKAEGKGADRVVTVRIDKTKDDDDSREIRLLPRVVAIDGMTRRTGEPETSVVLVPEQGASFAVPGLDPAVSHAVALLDRLGAPTDLGRDRMRMWLTHRQVTIRNAVLASAIAHRKKRDAPVPADERPAAESFDDVAQGDDSDDVQ